MGWKNETSPIGRKDNWLLDPPISASPETEWLQSLRKVDNRKNFQARESVGARGQGRMTGRDREYCHFWPPVGMVPSVLWQDFRYLPQV